MNNHLPTHVWRTMNDALRAVPHVSGTAWWTVAGMGPAVTLVIKVDGWGPTLHEATYDVTSSYADERHMLADAVPAAHRAAADQRTLADHAASLGIDRPLFHDGHDAKRELTPADADHVAHMHIERVLAAALIASRGPAGAAEKIVRCVDLLLQARQTSAHRLTQSGAQLVLDAGRIVIQPAHVIGGPALATLHGRTLDLRGRVPATLLAAATGRTLGSVVATGIAALDAATIERTLAYGVDALQLTTPSDLVRIGDHPELARGLATACRWRIAA